MSDPAVRERADRFTRRRVRDDPSFAFGRCESPAHDSMPGELLWTLQKDGERFTAELTNRGSYGLELRVLRNGDLYFEHRHAWREFALEEAVAKRRTLEAYGWHRSADGEAE